MQSFASVKKEIFKKDPAVKKAYYALAPEYKLIQIAIEKRIKKYLAKKI